MTPNSKKHEYWNHWVNYIFVQGVKPHGVTGPRLKKIKPIIWHDDDFWFDIVARHSGELRTPEQMQIEDLPTYNHMIGNFTGMVYQSLVENCLVK